MEHFSVDQISAMLVGAYDDICKFLLRLPIPVELPPVEEEQENPGIAAAAVDRARETIGDLPMEALTTELVDQLLLEWRTGVEQLAVILHAGPAKHRMDAISNTLLRMAERAELVDNRLRPKD